MFFKATLIWFEQGEHDESNKCVSVILSLVTNSQIANDKSTSTCNAIKVQNFASQKDSYMEM